MDAGWVREIVATPGHALARSAAGSGIDIHEADERVLAAICDAKTPQGIVAECAIPDTDLGSVLSATGPVVICDRLADPGNLGTIIRTAEAVGAAGVLTSHGSVDAWNPKVVRASAGSIFRLPVVSLPSAVEAITVTQESGRHVIALTSEASQSVFSVVDDLRESSGTAERLAWIVGSEAHGISPEAIAQADRNASIPMRASVESLNAAISVAICLYVAIDRDDSGSKKRT